MTQRRRGFTLVETLAVTTMISTILTLAAITIGLIMRSERTGRDSLAATQTGHRMARQFRQDVHAAHSATVTPGKQNRPRLTLKSPGHPTVTWTHVPSGLRRTVDTTPARIETYRTSAPAVTFRIEPSVAGPQTTRLISLLSTPASVPNSNTTATWPNRITAAFQPEPAP